MSAPKPKQLTQEEKDAWRTAVNRTWNTIGDDCDAAYGETAKMSPWVCMEVTLDADRVMQYGGLSKDEYAKFNQWVKDVYLWKATSRRACSFIGKELELTLSL